VVAVVAIPLAPDDETWRVTRAERRLGMRRKLPSELAEEARIAAAEAKYGPTPESLKLTRDRWVPCSKCGEKTPGALHAPKPTVALDGSYVPPPPVMCNKCSPEGSRAQKAFRYKYQRLIDNKVRRG
jgi:hypothetical protein